MDHRITSISTILILVISVIFGLSSCGESPILTDIHETYQEENTCKVPQFTVIPGTFATDQNVGLFTETSGAQILYTLDGGDPSGSSSTFTGDISIKPASGQDSITVTIRAIAVKNGMIPSPELSGTFIIDHTLTLYNLTISKNGSGYTTPAGTVSVYHNVREAIEATPTTGYDFTSWTVDSGNVTFDDDTDPTTNVIVRDGNAAITATFVIKTFHLTVSNNGHCDTTPAGTLSVSYNEATSITATNIDTGYHFVKWKNDYGSPLIASPNSSSTTVRLTTEDSTVSAETAINTYTLTCQPDNAGMGSVSPSSATVDHGAARSITATAVDGYIFDRWAVTSGTASIADTEDPTTTVTLTSGSATVTAYFEEWHGTELLHNQINGGRFSSIAVKGDIIDIAYVESGTSDKLYYIRSTDKGKSWSTPKLITSTSYGNPDIINLSYSVSFIGGFLHYDIVFIAYETSNGIRVYKTGYYPFANTDDYAVTGSGYYHPSIAASTKGEHLYIGYTNYNGMYVAKSTDGGANWNGTTVATGFYPLSTDIACSDTGNRIYIACYEQTNQDVWMARSINSGSSYDHFHWASTDQQGYNGLAVECSSDGTYYYLAYYNNTDSTVMTRWGYYGHNTSTAYTAATGVSPTLRDSVSLSVDDSTGNFHLAYLSGSSLHYRRSCDIDHWTGNDTVSRTVTTSADWGTDIASNGNRIYISYSDRGLYYAKSIDNGNEW